MNERVANARVLVEQALAAGRPALVELLRAQLEVAELRAIAKQFGFSPRGGFRLERAPKDVLARGIAEVAGAPMIDAIVAAIDKRLGPAPAEPPADPAETAVEARRVLHEQQMQRLRERLERAEAAAERSRVRADEARHQVETAQMELTRLRAANADLGRQLERAAAARAGDPAVLHRLHERERELEAIVQAEEATRRRLSEQAARLRALESELEELLPLVPKGKRKQKPEQPALADHFRLPRFTDRFYESLRDKDRRSVERAVQAALLFCVEGPSYPGLEVKQLEGGDGLWSLRASLKLRVYFRLRDDGDVEFLALADREDQVTTIKRLREAWI